MSFLIILADHRIGRKNARLENRPALEPWPSLEPKAPRSQGSWETLGLPGPLDGDEFNYEDAAPFRRGPGRAGTPVPEPGVRELQAVRPQSKEVIP